MRSEALPLSPKRDGANILRILICVAGFALSGCAGANEDQAQNQAAKESLDALFAEHPDFDKGIETPFPGDPQHIGDRAAKIFSIVISQLPPLEKNESVAQEPVLVKRAKAQADAGNADAQLRLGIWYLTGAGSQQDIKRGVAMLEKAAAGGEPKAMYGLARMYESGLAVPVDEQTAAQFYLRLASGQSWRTVKNRLGAMYEDGTGFSQDFEKAMYWYKAAAEPAGKYMPGIAKSKYNVGRLYAQGKGVQKDFWEAAEWFIDAADYVDDGKNAFPPAQCALAIMYLTGLGVQKDEWQADYWLAKPGTLSSEVCGRIAKERGITPMAPGAQRPAPVFRAAANTAGSNANPHFQGPYPFDADELLEKLLEVAKLPDGYVTKEQVEQIFGFTFPPESGHPVNSPGTNDGAGKPLSYTTEAGKDWYFQVTSYNYAANESVFDFQWGDLRHEKVGVLHEPPPGMCIAAEKLIPELEKLGWVLEREHSINMYGDRNRYRKGRYGYFLLSVDDFNSKKNCILEFDISRFSAPLP